MFMKFLFTTTLLLATVFRFGNACSVLPGTTLAEEIQNHDWVFKGTVRSVAFDKDIPMEEPKNITLNVVKIWKNDVNTGLSVDNDVLIQTAANSALCGIEPNVNETWIIFASANGWTTLKENGSALFSETRSTELDTYFEVSEEEVTNQDPPVEEPHSCKSHNEQCSKNDECCSRDCNTNSGKCTKFRIGKGRYLRSSFMN